MHTLVHVKNAYTVMTICLIALGAALLFMPQLGLKTMCMLYGVFLIIYGVTKLSGYFAKDLFQLAFQFDLALGIFVEIDTCNTGVVHLLEEFLKIRTSFVVYPGIGKEN